MEMKKGLMALAITVCFLYAADRLFNFYYQHVPVAKEGECLSLHTGRYMRSKIKIVRNNFERGEALVITYFDGGLELMSVQTYSDMRNLQAEKVKCEE